MMERGFNPLAYHFILAADGVTKDALGANVEGIFGRSAWEATLERADSKAFVAAYQAKFNRLPAYHSAAAYSAGQVIAAAIKAKGVDRTAIRDYIASNEVETVLAYSLEKLRGSYAMRRIVRRGTPIHTPTYEVEGQMIWGATARILGELLERLG